MTVPAFLPVRDPVTATDLIAELFGLDVAKAEAVASIIRTLQQAQAETAEADGARAEAERRADLEYVRAICMEAG